MIKAWYGPATEDLVKELMPSLSGRESESEVAEWVTVVVDTLRAHGYSITIEVEVHGDMAKALESLGGDRSDYVTRGRLKRHREPVDHSMCGGGCPID